jgi:hypothetical protein
VSTSFQIVLFLHISFLLVGFSAGTVMVVCAAKLRAANTGAEAFPWGMLASKTALAFPIAIVGLFLTGAYMTSKHHWGWGTGWIDAAIGGLVVLMAEGAILGGRHGKELGAALKQNGPGPLSDHIRALNSDRLHWAITLGAPGLVLGIMWNMLHKPGLGIAIVDMAVGYGIGVVLGVLIASRQPQRAPEPATGTAAS